MNLIDFYLPDLRLSLQCLVLAVGGEYIPVFGGNITMPSIVYGMKIVAQNVQTIIVPNSGHWIQEEQPVLLVKLLNNFFSSKPTTEASK